MPTNQKTSLGLNNWLGGDKPLRDDFAQDNRLLDSLLKNHFADEEKHLTAQDRAQLAGFTVNTYQGDGASMRDIALPFQPRLAVVFQSDAFPLAKAEGKAYYTCNFAVAAQDYPTSSAGLFGNTLTVYQMEEEPAAGEVGDNLNKNSALYVYVLFR